MISTHMSEVGEEQFNGQFYETGLTDVAYSPELRHGVFSGATSIKVQTQTD